MRALLGTFGVGEIKPAEILLRPVPNMAVIRSRDRGGHIGFRLGRRRRMAKWMPFLRRPASHKQVIYMATFLTRFSPFCQDFRHFLVSARGKLGLDRACQGG